MKTSQIARGIVGALSLAGVIGAIGCSADAGYEGAAGDGEIGSSEQALTTIAAAADLASATNAAGVDLTPNPVGRQWAASCEIKFGTAGGDPFVKFLFGGFDSAGTTALDEAFINTGSGNWKQVTGPGTIQGSTQERGMAKGFQVPGTPNACVFVGGSTTLAGGTARTRALKVTLTKDGSGNPVTAWADAGVLSDRRFHELMLCGSGNGKVMAIGGHDVNGFTNPVTGTAGFQVWDGSTTWTSKLALPTPVSGFGLAVKDSTKLAIAGGVPSGGITNVVQAFTISNDANCDVTALNTTATIREEAASGTAADGRFGNVAFFDPGTDDLYVTAGTEQDHNGATSVPTSLLKYTVNFASGVTFSSQTASFLNTGTRFPSLAFDPGSALLYLAGGEGNNATKLGGTPVANLQEIDINALTLDASTTSGSLTARLGSAAEYVRTIDKVIVTAGKTAQPSTVTTTSQVSTQ